MLQQRRTVARGLLLTVMACTIILPLCAYTVLLRVRAPTRLFKKYVLDPVPPSVSEIKVDHDQWRQRYAYVFTFNIDETGLDTIVRSRPFGEARIAFWTPGSVYWVWKGQLLAGAVMCVYPPPQRKPSWFTAETWKSPHVYAFLKEGHDSNTQLLLYNPELQQACFIIRSGD